MKVTSSGQVVEFQYDAFDRKTGKTVDTGANGSVDEAIVWAWDGQDVVMQFVDSDGDGTTEQFELTNHYLYGDMVDMLLAEEQTNVPGSTDNILWPLADHLGSVRDLVDSSGVIREHRVYNSFGNVVDELDYDASGNAISSSSTSAIDSIFGYTGREWDDDIDLQYNRARWFDPKTGRWLSQDPIGFNAGDSNLYRYVGNGPTNATDPSGESRVTPEGVPAAGGGHHVVPFARWKNKHLPVAVQDVFNQVIPHSKDHANDRAHRGYSKVVGEMLDDWLSKFDDVSKVTPKQAQQFWECVRHSDDPYIKGYLDLIDRKVSKAKVGEWFAETGKDLLENRNVVSGLAKSARVVGTIASKAGKVFKVLAIGTAVYYVSEGGVIYAAERTVKDALFFDEIRPHVERVARIVDGKIDAKALAVLEKRFRFLPEDMREPYIKRTLQDYPDIYRLKYGCDPESF